MGINAGQGKVIYAWISPNITNAGPTLKGVVVIIVIVVSGLDNS